MFVTGDLHGYEDISKLNSKRFPANKHLTKEDYVIVAGDFGLVWDHQQDELYWRKWLARKNFTTLFIDGNHENFDLLNSYPVEQWNGGKIHKINDSILHLMRGQVFSIHGLKVFTFGGAQSHDKAYRKENVGNSHLSEVGAGDDKKINEAAPQRLTGAFIHSHAF